jgi:hypothetical protein
MTPHWRILGLITCPRGLPSGAVGDVLAGRWDDHGVAEDRGRYAPHGLRTRTAADEEHAFGADALSDQRVQTVRQATEEALDRRTRDVRGRR